MDLVVENDLNFIKVAKCSNIELKQLKISLTKRIENAHFNPKVKTGHWDGYISFLDNINRFPLGLWHYVKEICDTYGFEFNLDGMDKLVYTDFNPQDFIDWQAKFFENHSKKPRDYQINSSIEIIKWRRCSSEIATSAGKTLIIFMVWAYLKTINASKRMLIVVPNESLIIQTMENFEEYSKDKTCIKYKVQAIGGGRDTTRKDVDIVIGTYQTLTKLDQTFFNDFDIVCVDEAHHTNTTSVKNILSMCKNSLYRFGLSGTLKVKDITAGSLTTIGLLGPMVNKISASFLFKNNYTTPVHIRMLFLDYLSDDIRLQLLKLKEQKNEIDGSRMLSIEKQLVVENQDRFEYVVNIISKVKKNSLVLFHNIKDRYGERVFDRLKEILDNNYEIFYVDGGVADKERQIYIEKMDNDEPTIKILIASFGTFSTGISMNNLHYIFLLESFKSERIIKQSLGRGMRLGEDKPIVRIIDFVDDFSINGHKNYLLKHGEEREAIYKEESFVYQKIPARF